MARWDRQEDAIPEWFFEAIETPATSHQVAVQECDVAYRRWGDQEKPAVLLIHGMFAHSHWWDFIAPLLLDDYQVLAMDLTGMGDSDYRHQYTGDIFAEEVKAVVEHANLQVPLSLVGHSFGGFVATHTVNVYPDLFNKLVLVDSGLRHPDEEELERPPMGGRAKLYPDKKTAVARFRLQPPQDCENTYIVEYVANQSLIPMEGGWTWKFDDDLPASLTGIERSPETYENLSINMGIIAGAGSKLFSERSVQYTASLTQKKTLVSVIENAQHHVFLDQPQRFVEALRTMLKEL